MSPAPATTGSFANELYAGMAPLAFADEENGWALLHLTSAFALPFQLVEDLARDTDEGPGWSALVDVSRCPDFALPWLAQFVGAPVPPRMVGESDADYAASLRDLIVRAPNKKRGTVDAIRARVERELTGAKTVTVTPREGGAAAALRVETVDSETPSTGRALAAALQQKPAGLRLSYVLLSSVPTYADIAALPITYADLPSWYYDYDDLRSRLARGPLVSYADVLARYPSYAALAADLDTYDRLRKLH